MKFIFAVPAVSDFLQDWKEMATRQKRTIKGNFISDYFNNKWRVVLRSLNYNAPMTWTRFFTISLVISRWTTILTWVADMERQRILCWRSLLQNVAGV